MPDLRLKNRIIIAFGLLVLLTTPTLLSNSPIIQTTLAQTEGEQPSSPAATNNTSGEQGIDEAQLPSQEGFSVQVLATNFSAPYNILYGPDGALWITERVGKDITRIDPNTGDRLSSMPVPDVWQSAPQDGLMGMAFDPDFNNTHYIYVAYTYVGDQGTDLERQTKITRFTYNPENRSIAEPLDLISGLAGSTDHNSGRLTFGPDGMLYYTIGDQGKNYLANYCMNNEAQHLPTAEHLRRKGTSDEPRWLYSR
jgi:glucose/arabinose dehydrogenase